MVNGKMYVRESFKAPPTFYMTGSRLIFTSRKTVPSTYFTSPRCIIFNKSAALNFNDIVGARNNLLN